MPLIGCHVSIGGGVQNAPERGKTLGCDTMQSVKLAKMTLKWLSPTTLI